MVKTDAKNRHVLAAAIASNADLVVTNNIQDFDTEEMDSNGVEACTPDQFLFNQLDLHPPALDVVDDTFHIIKPLISMADYLAKLKRSKLDQFAERYRLLRAQRDQFNSLQWGYGGQIH